MFCLLPWASAVGGNKVMAEEIKMLAKPQKCASPGVDNLALPPLKRKRSDSSDPATCIGAPLVTKLCQETADKEVSIDRPPPTVDPPELTPRDSTAFTDSASERVSRSPFPPQHSQNSADRAATPRKMDVDKLRETLEAQLSLEVLLKHNELRLIDQEIAKCQVALEQLRRCAEIPYPGSSVAGASQSVSNGTGMAVLSPGNGPAPYSPAPWGVTSGPYTRHYARWLLPDPRFDGGDPDAGMSLAAGAGQPVAEGRTTRGNPGDGGYMAGKSRAQRGSGGPKLQALPSGYPAPKDKAGPMIIRRKSDGVLVKLICLDCRRDNFSSTQGFINHCRIAHNRNFASHDAAAMASGEPVEVDEAGAIIGGKSESTSGAAAGYVHPLVRSAHAIESTTTASASQKVAAGSTPRETPAKVSQRNPSNASFAASPETPHLSSLMQLRGIGLDLGQLVGDAKTVVDMDVYSSGEESDDGDSTGPSTGANQDQTQLGVRGSRQPMRTTVTQSSSQRPNSRKGLEKASHKPPPLEALTPTRPTPYTSPYGPATTSLARTSQADELRDIDGLDTSANLSPNTVESNQAPSLVSDDDDYEAASDSESPSPSSSEVGDDEQDFDHIEVEDDEGNTTSTTATGPKTEPHLASPTTHHHPGSLSKPLKRGNGKKKDRLISASIVPLARGKDEKRVSFVSPRAKAKKDASGRKQR